MKKPDIFELEQSIIRCWSVVDDIDLLYKRVGDSSEFDSLSPKQMDALMNILLGVKEVYDYDKSRRRKV